MTDGKDDVGVLVLLENAPRNWAPNDVLVFKMISEQVAISLSNAGLRRLVKDLSVTDENSGLLKRASYLDLLMGEMRRSLQHKTSACVSAAFAAGRQGSKGARRYARSRAPCSGSGSWWRGTSGRMIWRFATRRRVLRLCWARPREKEALMVVEKMRRLITAAMGEKQLATSLNAGVAEAVIRPEFDPVDIVTEVINRVESALEKSVAEGAGKSVALAAAMSAAAVA